jgi:hypothetical protein
MQGGLMQLVAYGAQDVYFTGNPQITFFQSTYNQYTNFDSEQTFQGTANFRGKVTLKKVTLTDDFVEIKYLFEEQILSDEDCSICCQCMTGNKLVKCETCNNIFDHECIKQWLNMGYNKKCPMCRSLIDI